MKKCLILFLFCACRLEAESVRTPEPAPDEVWQLVRAVTANAQTLDSFDYDFELQSQEMESALAGRTGGLPLTPEIRIARHRRVNSLSVSVPDLMEPLRGKAEDRLNEEILKIDFIRMLKESGWNLFASWLKSVDGTGQYDLLDWTDGIAVIEFNDLNDPMSRGTVQSVRMTVDRRRSALLRLLIWCGKDRSAEIVLDLSPEAVYPESKQPRIMGMRVTQTGFSGPQTISLKIANAAFTRVEEGASNDPLARWMPKLQRLGMEHWRLDKARADAEGRLILDFSGSSFTNLAALQGLPIRELNLNGTQVTDLSPLRGLPLQVLSLDNIPATDLSPLGELPLTTLSLRGSHASDLGVLSQIALKHLDISNAPAVTGLQFLAGLPLEGLTAESVPITDLSPLRGMQLKELIVNHTRIRDLSVLRGQPLVRLEIQDTPVETLEPLTDSATLISLAIGGEIKDFDALRTLKLLSFSASGSKISDISGLRRQPLREVFLDGTNVGDLSPLLDSPALQRITVPMLAENVEVLRKLPRLQHISYRLDWSSRLPAQTASEFWKDFDPQKVQSELAKTKKLAEVLKLLGAVPEINSDGTFGVNLSGKPVQDLSVLRDYPISSLNLEGTQIRDLASLRGFPLRSLNISRTAVADLSPLAGMKLTNIVLNGCPVSDLRPLRGMELEEVMIGIGDLSNPEQTSTHVSDLSPLAGMPIHQLAADGTKDPDLTPLAACRRLETAVLPKKVRHLEALKKCASLKSLSLGWPGAWDKLTPAEDFWKDYDAQNGAEAKDPAHTGPQ